MFSLSTWASPRLGAFIFILAGLSLGCGGSSHDVFGEESSDEFVDLLGSEGRDPNNLSQAPTLTPTDEEPLPLFAFPGAPSPEFASTLQPGQGPETAGNCTVAPLAPLAPRTQQPASLVCFYPEGQTTTPAATIEQVVEVVEDQEYIHLRLTLNPSFVDNSFGATAVGWPEPGSILIRDNGKEKKAKARKFKDLVGSDHAEIQLFDTAGEAVTHFKLDYLSESDDSLSGYASLGVIGGDGEVIVGEPEWFLGAATSLDRNLNACEEREFVVDSPQANADYLPTDALVSWDYRVSYEVWVASEAFGDAGFGRASIDTVHASPSKTGDNTEVVTPGPCPVGPTPPASEPPNIR